MEIAMIVAAVMSVSVAMMTPVPAVFVMRLGLHRHHRQHKQRRQ